ncbi:MAG: HAD-IA family hydrolase, partial [Planctomycetota bacterium]|nr:HAD-IA family hydrolase [Planctomycetota bacterium]
DIFRNFKSLLAASYQTLEVTEQPGTTATFSQLRAADIKVVLNTGYDRITAQSLIKKIGWESGKDFDGLVTASDVSNGRPSPDMIHHAMRLTGIEDPSKVAKVGDSQIDIDEGKNASCGLTVGVTTGAQTREQLESVQPSCVIDNLKELLSILELNTPAS